MDSFSSLTLTVSLYDTCYIMSSSSSSPSHSTHVCTYVCICLYTTGAGFPGFWYHLGFLQDNLRLDGGNQDYHEDDDQEFYCYSSGCLGEYSRIIPEHWQPLFVYVCVLALPMIGIVLLVMTICVCFLSLLAMYCSIPTILDLLLRIVAYILSCAYVYACMYTQPNRFVDCIQKCHTPRSTRVCQSTPTIMVGWEHVTVCYCGTVH